MMQDEHLLFVTGRLAERGLNRVLEGLSQKIGFRYEIQVMPISVAALLTTQWVLPRIQVAPEIQRVVLPGYCRGDLEELSHALGVPVVLGPKDLRKLPEFFGQTSRRDESFGQSDIEVIAEINHAKDLTPSQLERVAKSLLAAGADMIDLGCDPGVTWEGVPEAVACLRELGARVSIDSFNPKEIVAGVNAGAELVLSMNSSNRSLVDEVDVEWVLIPDEPATLEGLHENLEFLERRGARFRVDPILEPIGMGFSRSLNRYFQIRERFPEAEMMMGIGNLTELTDVDSAGINTLLLGYCQELKIRSVLTTQVISWAQSSVRECVAARELVHFACENGVPPKRLDNRLVMLRDPAVTDVDPDDLREMADQLKDSNYRMFLAEDQMHLVAAQLHLRDQDPFELFDQLMDNQPKNVDASHAFYLGYELCKAYTALTLGKDYRQDEALDWGLLTRPETDRHRLRHRRSKKQVSPDPPSDRK
jgi:dihydropteroate synthase